ncbi:MAG: OmpH family outer membrane protein [Bacteroidales bacterium]|nr:OmpH family outer membrane protein [Bacteroidales bacterium]MBR5651395.1 OmpH family outer membrane protein [Bacteroidales bacterium]
MKRQILIILALLAGVFSVQAQKFAFVDTDYILSKIPEYNDAQAQIDDLSAQWQNEMEAIYTEVNKLYQEYQAKKAIYPEEVRAKKEAEILAKEKEIKDFQQKKFGTDGELYKKRTELVKPIQEKVFTAIQNIAEKENYAVVLNKAEGVSIIYSNSKYDISDDVLDKLGYSY